MKPAESPCLVIPDVHQDIEWAETILRAEADSVEEVVFLGDYFDPKRGSAASPAQTADYFSQLSGSFSCAFTFLVGNHDLPYLFDALHGTPSFPFTKNPYSTNSYSPVTSREIEPLLSQHFLSSLEPFALRHGWLLSHAGLHRDYLYDTDLEALQRELKAQLAELPLDPHPALAAIGRARGGGDRFGGVTWQDWRHEFEDCQAWPQLVGHTVVPEPERNGRSWNLDTRQNHYALLTSAGLEIRSAVRPATNR